MFNTTKCKYIVDTFISIPNTLNVIILILHFCRYLLGIEIKVLMLNRNAHVFNSKHILLHEVFSFGKNCVLRDNISQNICYLYLSTRVHTYYNDAPTRTSF